MENLFAVVATVATLVVLESILSIDNSVVLAAQVNRLPRHLRRKALTYGLVGAYVFRGLALFCAAWIARISIVKVFGGAYLIHMCCTHISKGDGEAQTADSAPESTRFWSVVFGIELTDLTLSIDNVLTAVALSPKLWVVMTGVFIGIIAVRFSAALCSNAIERWPWLKTVAYLIVGWVGAQLVVSELFDVHMGELVRLLPLALIAAAGLLYFRYARVREVASPVVNWAFEGTVQFTALIDWLIKPLDVLFKLVIDHLGNGDPVRHWLLQGLLRARGIAKWVLLPVVLAIVCVRAVLVHLTRVRHAKTLRREYHRQLRRYGWPFVALDLVLGAAMWFVMNRWLSVDWWLQSLLFAAAFIGTTIAYPALYRRVCDWTYRRWQWSIRY